MGVKDAMMGLEAASGQELDGDGVTQTSNAGALQKSYDNLKMAFAAFDKNGDGVLDAHEFKQIMMRVVPDGAAMTDEEAGEFIEFFDDNGDGKLSVDEFCKAMVGLTGGDKDEDGDLDEKEMEEGVREAATASMAALS